MELLVSNLVVNLHLIYITASHLNYVLKDVNLLQNTCLSYI